MILSDRTLREQIEAGRIVVEPFDPALIQPSSIDVRIGNLFRVFRNHTSAVIDVKQNQEDLTELITIGEDGVFMLHPGEFVLGSTLERIGVPDDLVARIEGKALAIWTEIPTPDGWTTMGDLRPGDEVFDDAGRAVRVGAVSEVMTTRPCHEVVFCDGTSIVADAAHQWVTTTAADRAAGRLHSIRTTDEIARSLTIDGDANHQVHRALAVQHLERQLPTDPYAFGVGLAEHDAGRAGSIPSEYLEASVAQRAALLRGLMDTAGSFDDDGRHLVFRSADEALVRAVHELATSLGLLATFDKDDAATAGIGDGPRYRARFDESDTSQRSIVAVRPVPSVPVRCIEVDTEAGIFLATRSFIPTHNSSLGRLGLIIHSTAGFIDAGFDGHVTLELTNIATLPITLYPNMKIGQVSFMRMTTPAENPYGRGAKGSKYQGQRGPTPSRYWENFQQ